MDKMDWFTLGQSQFIEKNTSATPRTVVENYFWFAAATVENDRNRLDGCQENTFASFGGPQWSTISGLLSQMLKMLKLAGTFQYDRSY